MNLGQQEKLEKLINASAILSPQERTEWLGLLDLMSDKQLGELEKILSSSKQSAVSSQQPSATVQAVAPLPSSQPQVKPPVSPAQMSKLSHIMNLPRIQPIDQKSQIPSPKLQTEATKPKPSFGQKLKSIFAEKELTSGKPENELELPPPQSPAAPAKPVISMPKAALTPKLPHPPVPRPPVQPPQAIVMSISSTENLAAAIKANSSPQTATPPFFVPKTNPKPSIVQPPAGAVPAQASSGINWQAKGALAQPMSQRPELSPPQFAPGIRAQKPIQRAEIDSMNRQVKEAVEREVGKRQEPGAFEFTAAPQTPKKPKQEGFASLSANLMASKMAMHLQENKPKAAASTGPKLENLTDLNGLNPKVFQESDLDSLAAKVKNLTDKYGYHDVVFNLEKSPLFKTYIQTGLELLSKQTNFEQLGTASNYLSRREFERMADLLMQIQGG